MDPEPSDVPVKLAPFEWRFAPAVRKADEGPLKQAFAQAVLDWIGGAIREAVDSLTSDTGRRLKAAFRIESGGVVTNRKTGQSVAVFPACRIVVRNFIHSSGTSFIRGLAGRCGTQLGSQRNQFAQAFIAQEKPSPEQGAKDDWEEKSQTSRH
jgi:hypothetical protein